MSWLTVLPMLTDEKNRETIKDKYLSSVILGKGELVYKGKFSLPVQEPYTRTSPYGMRDLEGNGKYMMHRGLDIQPVHHSNIMFIYRKFCLFLDKV